MNVGVSRVIGDVIAFQTGPGGAGDNFTRLRLNIAKANLLVLFVQRQMLLDNIMPKMLVAGFVCLTITSVVITGVFVNYLVV